ncbi:LAFE_0D02938g1_1 [Lachancea fermentati]|uniref:LAFE_0D02938g1_1 n=1 Tax=Lachancea fermentati TaxID=4955 RepID=A0A1G4MB17_LACFM|nr:LAFE_0D02938g1_1 [Lachancea fermentati]
MASNDDMLKMFFDEDFIPQAFVDVLLSSQNTQLNELRVVSSSLLSKLDYYTGRLTQELEVSIENLQKPAEPLAYLSTASESGKTTKLEYYLDTLANSVKTLEGDISKVTKQLNDMKVINEESQRTVKKIKDLENVKLKLSKVLDVFEKVKSLVVISMGSDKQNENIPSIPITDFKLSLKTMQDAINSSLKSASTNESSDERNEELLQKINFFVEMKPIFKGLTKFYPAYSEFVEQIKAGMQVYLQGKDIEAEFMT